VKPLKGIRSLYKSFSTEKGALNNHSSSIALLSIREPDFQGMGFIIHLLRFLRGKEA